MFVNEFHVKAKTAIGQRVAVTVLGVIYPHPYRENGYVLRDVFGFVLAGCNLTVMGEKCVRK